MLRRALPLRDSLVAAVCRETALVATQLGRLQFCVADRQRAVRDWRPDEIALAGAGRALHRAGDCFRIGRLPLLLHRDLGGPQRVRRIDLPGCSTRLCERAHAVDRDRGAHQRWRVPAVGLGAGDRLLRSKARRP